MQFLSMMKQTVDVQVAKYCGDGCCGWRENETETVRQGEVFEPDFEYGSYAVDECYFFEQVQEGYFVAFDDEAAKWVNEQTKEAQTK